MANLKEIEKMRESSSEMKNGSEKKPSSSNTMMNSTKDSMRDSTIELLEKQKEVIEKLEEENKSQKTIISNQDTEIQTKTKEKINLEKKVMAQEAEISSLKKKSKSLQEDLDTARKEHIKRYAEIEHEKKNEIEKNDRKNREHTSWLEKYHDDKIKEKDREIRLLEERVKGLMIYHVAIAIISLYVLLSTKLLRDDFGEAMREMWSGICKAAMSIHAHGVVLDGLVILVILLFIWFVFIFKVKKWKMSIFRKAFSWWDEYHSSCINVASLAVVVSGSLVKSFWDINIVSLWVKSMIVIFILIGIITFLKTEHSASRYGIQKETWAETLKNSQMAQDGAIGGALVLFIYGVIKFTLWTWSKI